jgi:hypothetical protein
MKMGDVVTIAKARGLNPFGKKKQEVIRLIQRAENNRDCFNRGEAATCGQTGCSWRSDCK